MIIILYTILAVFFDLKFYKIPNVLCFFIAVTGIWISAMESGVSGFGGLLLGMGIPIITLYGFFYCGMMGAGDIKELAAVGTFFGKDIWKVMVLSFLFNGLAAFCKVLKEGNFKERFCYLSGYVRDCRLEKRILDDYESGERDRIHFSIGIMCASICMVWMN
ncbi:MAG TPA: prepilin peptidase [Candidatus Fimousia stercorigallinarum]|nr:prepilin peptidase [Candidatus Fimousia stercorigallinarum]